MKKNLIGLFMALVAITALVGCGKKKEEAIFDEYPSVVEEELVVENVYPSDVTFETYDPTKIYLPLTTLKAKLVEPAQDVITAIRNGADEVDLSDYDLTSTDIKDLWMLVCYSNPICLLVGYDSDATNSSTLSLYYPGEKDEILQSIFKFELDMDNALTEISKDYSTSSERTRECYNYVLNNFEYKDVFEKRAESKDSSSLMLQFFDEYFAKELSYVNSCALFSFMCNQFDVQNVGILIIGSYMESFEDPVLDEEFDGASQILNISVAIDDTSYLCDIAMDMVSKDGLENTAYEPKYFGMGLDTRAESFTVYGGQIITLLSPNYGLASTNPSKEDMFRKD